MVLLTRNQASRPTRPTTTIWNTQPRIVGSFHGATLVRGMEPNASTAIPSPCAHRRFGRSPTVAVGPDSRSCGQCKRESPACNIRFAVQTAGQKKTAALAGGGPFERPFAGWLADRRGVLQAALAPQLVDAAVDLEQRARADVAVKALGVVTDALDDVVDPLFVDPQRLAHARRDAEDALDHRVIA